LPTILERANELFEAGKYKEALASYRQGLKVDPEHGELLYNAGVAAFLIKDFSGAREHWERLLPKSPDDIQLRAKLVQAYQALSDLKARDEAREQVYRLWREGKTEELADPDYYCRDQFEVGEQRLMVFEHFELEGDRAIRYVFYVLKPGQSDPDLRISLGSYDSTNRFAIQRGTVRKDQRLFHLDGYWGSSHATYGFFVDEPSYDSIREQVIAIVQGKLKPVSSTIVQPAKPPLE
jgi:tetratricopeptide (TPR) repeat protein